MTTINHSPTIPITPITREQTRQELCSRIKNEKIEPEQITQTLNKYLEYKQYKWDHKTFKTPFHSDPIHKTEQFLLCLKGNMRNEIYTIYDDKEFHQDLFNTHKMAPNVDFTRKQLNRDAQTIQKDQAKLNHYMKVWGHLEKLDIIDGRVVYQYNKPTPDFIYHSEFLKK